MSFLCYGLLWLDIWLCEIHSLTYIFKPLGIKVEDIMYLLKVLSINIGHSKEKTKGQFLRWDTSCTHQSHSSPCLCVSKGSLCPKQEHELHSKSLTENRTKYIFIPYFRTFHFDAIFTVALPSVVSSLFVNMTKKALHYIFLTYTFIILTLYLYFYNSNLLHFLFFLEL